MLTAALVLGALLAAAAVWFVARPFLRGTREDRARRAAGPSERIALEEQRDRALAALKELEFDHRTGKVSDDDYRSLVGGLRREVADALRALDVGSSVDVRSRTSVRAGPLRAASRRRGRAVPSGAVAECATVRAPRHVADRAARPACSARARRGRAGSDRRVAASSARRLGRSGTPVPARAREGREDEAHGRRAASRARLGAPSASGARSPRVERPVARRTSRRRPREPSPGARAAPAEPPGPVIVPEPERRTPVSCPSPASLNSSAGSAAAAESSLMRRLAIGPGRARRRRAGGGRHRRQEAVGRRADRVACRAACRRRRRRRPRSRARSTPSPTKIRGLEQQAGDVSERLVPLEHELELRELKLNRLNALLRCPDRSGCGSSAPQYRTALARLNQRLVAAYEADAPRTSSRSCSPRAASPTSSTGSTTSGSSPIATSEIIESVLAAKKRGRRRPRADEGRA